jgi:hypothetical protein
MTQRQPIKGLADHPETDGALQAYSNDPPPGTWIGRLDAHAWGRSTNLFCYFTDEATGQKYRLSVFSRSQYRAYQGGPAFDQEPLGGRFEITTGKSKNDMATFLAARKLEE